MESTEWDLVRRKSDPSCQLTQRVSLAIDWISSELSAFSCLTSVSNCFV